MVAHDGRYDHYLQPLPDDERSWPVRGTLEERGRAGGTAVLVLLSWLAMAVLPAVTLRLAWALVERWSGDPPWQRRRTVPYGDRALEVLVADLRRLEREFRRTEVAAVPYRAARLQALSLAYDCTLLDCCRLLEVPAPERPPWTPLDRLQVESALALAGLVW